MLAENDVICDSILTEDYSSSNCGHRCFEYLSGFRSFHANASCRTIACRPRYWLEHQPPDP